MYMKYQCKLLRYIIYDNLKGKKIFFLITDINTC